MMFYSRCHSHCKHDTACCGAGNAWEMPLLPCHATTQFIQHFILKTVKSFRDAI